MTGAKILGRCAALLACGLVASCGGPRHAEPRDFTSKDLNAALPEMRHLLVFADFGDRAQLFQAAFVDEMRKVTAACHIAVDFEVVEHATTLTLEPPKSPSPNELAAKAAAIGADGLLRTTVTNWNGMGAPGRLDQPLTFGHFSLSTTLSQQPAGKTVWSGTILQEVDGGSGGRALADLTLNRFAKQGALPGCRAESAKAG